MSDVSLERRFATALFSLAEEKGLGDPWLAALKRILEAFRQVKGLQAILVNRFADLSKRKRIVDRLGTELSLDREIVSFLKVLIDHKRLPAIAGIIRLFEAEIDKSKGRVQVEIRSAKPLSEALLGEIKTIVAQETNREPKLFPRVDPRLIGGLQFSWDGKLYDGSVLGELTALHRELGAHSH